MTKTEWECGKEEDHGTKEEGRQEVLTRQPRLDRSLADAQAAIDWSRPMPGYEDYTPGVWLGLSREPNLVLFARQLAAQRPIFRGGGCE